jgi:hypothetical protein
LLRFTTEAETVAAAENAQSAEEKNKEKRMVWQASTSRERAGSYRRHVKRRTVVRQELS